MTRYTPCFPAAAPCRTCPPAMHPQLLPGYLRRRCVPDGHPDCCVAHEGCRECLGRLRRLPTESVCRCYSPFNSHYFEGLSVCGANLCPAYFRQAEDEVSGKIGALQLQLALIGFEGFPLAFDMPLVEHYKCLGGKADVVPRQLVSPQGQVFECPYRLGVEHLVVLVNISAGRDKNRFRLEPPSELHQFFQDLLPVIGETAHRILVNQRALRF